MVFPAKCGQSRPSWRVIAIDLAQETDPDKIVALANELSLALLTDHGIHVGDFKLEDLPKRPMIDV